MTSTASLYGNLEPVGIMKDNYGAGLDEALKTNPESYNAADAQKLETNKQMAKTASAGMSAGGSLGSVLTGTGATGLLMGSTGVGAGALAAGLAVSYMEQQRQAEAAHERAVVEEAQNRKEAVQSAINAQLGAARMMGV